MLEQNLNKINYFLFLILPLTIIAGSSVKSGKVVRNSMLRVKRDDELIHEGVLTSLKRFKDDANEVGGYAVLKNKKTLLAFDLGKAPEKKFSKDYQAGPLSFEFNYLGEKVITNSGYFQDYKHQLNIISKSTATHSTLILDNISAVRFERDKYGHMLVTKNFKIC